jgi:copper chaperone
MSPAGRKLNLSPMTERLQLRVTGMSCGGCENAVKRAVAKLDGVREVTASHKDERVEVVYEAGPTGKAAITRAIEAVGYHVAG